MRLKGKETNITLYEFDEDVLREFKEWAKENNLELSRNNFLEFIFSEHYIEDYEEDSEFIDLELENFNEWINQ